MWGDGNECDACACILTQTPPTNPDPNHPPQHNHQSTPFHQVLASAIVDKYIGESARVIREMFGYAREHQPCVIFMDEVRSFV